MDNGAFKLLESATHRTLHAQNFARSSSQASLVLTDLLSRYLFLLASTCAKYSSHAGRTNLTARDALGALEEMGVTLDELSDYCSSEGKELNRYAAHTARRMEDLHEFRAALTNGMHADRDDAIPLFYQPFDGEEENEYVSESEMELDVARDVVMASPTDIFGPQRAIHEPRAHTPPPRQRTPPLPLSPVSNPASPTRKRSRIDLPHSPPNIPEFLPPLPRIVEPSADSLPRSTSPLHATVPPSAVQPSASSALSKIGDGAKPSLLLPSAPVALQPSTATSASDYTTPIPYSQSTLAQVSEWHLPPAAPPGAPHNAQQRHVSGSGQPLPTPRTQPSLISAYHHILTHPPPKDVVPAPNPARHRVALGLLALQERSPRWEPPDAVFSTSSPPVPRNSGVVPTHAIAVNDPLSPPAPQTPKERDKEDANSASKERVLPTSQPRPLTGADHLAPSIIQQNGRIPELSRTLLPPALYKRTTRLGHPPILQRGTQKLVYGPPINAPWNTSLQPTTTTPGAGPNSATPVANGAPKPDTVERRLGGEGKDANQQRLPDARLFATWDYEQKSFREPLSLARAVKLKGAQVHFAAGGVPSSAVEAPSRRGSMMSVDNRNGAETHTERRNSSVLTLPARKDSMQSFSSNGRRDSLT